MPRLSKEIKEGIKNLPKHELTEIVLKAASKEKYVLDYIRINYLDKENAEKELFNETKNDLEKLHAKGYKGWTDEVVTTNMLKACIKRINEFTKTSKNKIFEVELLLYILDIAFEQSYADFGTDANGFDFKVGQILKRTLTIVTKKIHEDYLLDYQEILNSYLSRLHSTSDHIEIIYNMPEEI